MIQTGLVGCWRWAGSLVLGGLLGALAPTLTPADEPTRPTGTQAQIPELPAPYHTKSVTKAPKVVGWPAGQMPTAPAGFTVQLYAEQLRNPRWLYQLPNGDVLVAESASKKQSANRITLLRDEDQDGRPDRREVFLEGLDQPFGMELIGSHFYVANTDAVLRFPYQEGQTRIEAKGEKIQDLPAGGYNNHWTRNLLAGLHGTQKLYIAVGSATNVDEEGIDAKDERRAAILEHDLASGTYKVYAAGLRNPCGMDWEPTTNTLWTVVNERDHLGDDLVPDYLTSVKEGGFYGWPYAYFGPRVDPRKKGQRPDLVAKTLVPDVALGAHTATLGLTFYRGQAFPKKYHHGAFLGQHGSWNRSEFVGYRVAFVPFENGTPVGEPEDFLTGFIKNESEVYGRPVCVRELQDGSLLVTDDSSNRIWRVVANSP